ncbi:eCIS core domain-containing protein [Actinophytocola oryzae]|uniref:Uncharacterized protein DUF4157 n=1 Tax=Actinophytocola oryzae TaxID=502181 RepID=A0A4R7VAZ6_9PSEU|nr:DUF4157 domain-containing protein [Actinophytocola oryzae]TDV46183.1 uncharacterized protein DUF4157 [Actinophytocola oryzae]
MRWPFRRKAAEQAVEATVERDRPQESVAAPSDKAAGLRAPARQWATLPVIPTVIPTSVPLVVGPAPVVPLLRLDRRGTSAVEPPTGTVTGLARPVVRVTETVVHQGVDLPVPTVRRPVVAAPREVVPLVDAVDEYVGEPREPATPHRAPGWLRFMPDWAKAGQSSPALPAIPGLPSLPALPAPAPSSEPAIEEDMVVAEPPSFLPPELRNPPKPDLPPRMEEDVRPADPVSPPARRRRPNLGQSRRLGLGAPISGPQLVHPEAPPSVVDGAVEPPPAPQPPPQPSQEPPPPQAAPARVVTEPAREPVAETAPEPAPEPAPVPLPEAPPVAREVPKPPSEPSPGTPNVEQSRPDVPAKPVAATYRATAELRPAPRRTRPRATVVDRVPTALANEVRNRQRADVADVPVYRGPKVGEAAKSRGARAFAAGGAVFLPDEAGPTDSPRTRGLLAHELVHAVQQRTLGAHLPAPDSPLGRQLEAEAQDAERFYGGESGAVEPQPLIHAPTAAPAVSTSAPEPDLSMAAQLATELTSARATTSTATPPQHLDSPFDAATTEEVGKIATESARHVVAEWTNPLLQQENGEGRHAPDRPGAHTAQGGGGFNAAARRDQLVAAAIATHNRNLAPGAMPVTSLSHEELTAIDRQVSSESGHGGHHGTGTHHGSRSHSTPPSQPPAQRYEPNSAASWMHAVTGMNMNYGFGEHGLSARVGSSDSWFSGRTNDRRPVGERVADQMGITNAATATQFDTDTWWQPEEDEAGQRDGGHDDDQNARHNGGSGLDLENVDLDELATRLYDRLRSRLRTELLVDRERAGLLTDFR